MLAPEVLTVCMAGLLAGSYTDLRTREVPDWVNYGLIFCGFGFALLRTVVYWDISYLIASVIGFCFFWLIAIAMYYTGQWGGGDSKMIMGLGALVGLSIGSIKGMLIEVPFLLNFVIYSLLFGALYGISWTAVLAIRHRKAFRKEYRALSKTAMVKKAKLWLIIVAAALLISAIVAGNPYRSMLLILTVLAVLTLYLFLFVKVVEKTCMFKRLPPQRLTVGDWIAEDVVVDGKHIVGPKDLGIEKHQIEELLSLKSKGKIDTVLVKEGIPFVPSFLLAFLACLFIGGLPIGLLF
jgi:prepilin signal peptidase PulO-like enzyme (type II secretory pathway)